MRAKRSIVLTALCATALLTACGDDGGESEANTAKETQADCQVQVEVTGDVKKSWEGDGYVIKGGTSGAFYKAEKGKVAVMLYPEQDDFPANGVVTWKGKNYTTQDTDGVDIADDGSGAEVDADATGVKPGQAVHLVASFAC